jgi:hypothetical protein
MPIILAIWVAEIGRIKVQGQPGQRVHETPISKITRAKCPGDVSQAVEHLLCKHTALSSNPSPTKTNQNILKPGTQHCFFVLSSSTHKQRNSPFKFTYRKHKERLFHIWVSATPRHTRRGTSATSKPIPKINSVHLLLTENAGTRVCGEGQTAFVSPSTSTNF